MKLVTYVVLMLFIMFSFCKKSDLNGEPKLIKAVVESTQKVEPGFTIDTIKVKSGDPIRFSTQGIRLDATVFIPMADSLFKLDGKEKLMKVGNVNYLLIPLLKEPLKGSKEEWTSRDYIVNDHSRKTTYEYSIYIHQSMKMVESKSSPKIIVDP